MRRTLISVLVAFIASVAAAAATCPAEAGPYIENASGSGTDIPTESMNWNGPSENDRAQTRIPGSKIDPNLLRLVVSPSETTPDSASSSLRSAAVSRQDRVQIQVLTKAADMESAKALLLSLGGEMSGTGTVDFVEGPAGSGVRIIQGWSPVQSLEELASDDAVSYVRLPLKAHIVQETGDESLAASFDSDAWHKVGHRGAGVKVGVLDSGFPGVLDREYQDLPLTEARSFVDSEPDDPSGKIAQGTQSLRTIHEIAPQAELYAARIETLVDAQEALSWLVNEVGVDVVRIPLVSLPSSDEANAQPDEETDEPVFAGDVYWATPEAANWKKLWFGPFEDRGDGFHLFAPNRNVEPIEIPSDAESKSENSLASHVFLGWENPEGANTDLDLHLLQWDGSGWNPVAESAKVRPGILSRHPLEYLSAESTGNERFYGYAVRGNTLGEDLCFEISIAENHSFAMNQNGGAGAPTSSQKAGIGALIKSSMPNSSALGIHSIVEALIENPARFATVLSADNAKIPNADTRSPECIEFSYPDLGLTYCVRDGLWEHFDCGTADAALSAQSIEVTSTVANDDTYIRILVNDSTVAQWHAGVGPDVHVENLSVDISAGDTITYSFGNDSYGCVEDPFQVKFCGTPMSATGSLQVTISPQEAVDAGAQWRVDGGAWRNSGATVSGLSVGGHTVSYKYVSGWVTPDDESVTISSGVTSTTTGTYVYIYSERQVLIALYDSTAGDNWTDNSGWKYPPLHTDGFAMPGSECGWFGIVCDEEDNYVEEIDLRSNNLSGSIPPELGNLSNLASLSLHSNQLYGTIPPELGHLRSLSELWLAYNQLNGTIPSELANLSSLSELWLSSNQIGGTIPPELGNLSNLSYLLLSSNQLSGTIPPELGNLSSLSSLWLDYNQLRGPIPPELGKLSSLYCLWLDSNQLWGCIPKSLGDCNELRYLTLNNNELSGEIPAELMRLTNLADDESDLRNNHLYTANADLKNFLDQKQNGGNWESSQAFDTNILRVEPSEQCGVYTPCFDSFQDAFTASASPSTIFVAEGEYCEKLVIENGDTLVLTWDKNFCCDPPSGPVILSGPLP